MLHSWENKHVLKCELDDAMVRKARQRRRAPPSPSVNQLAWSFDDMIVSKPGAHLWLSLMGLAAPLGIPGYSCPVC